MLAQLSSPKIFEMRQIISKEIAQLKSIAPLDKAGILSQLDAAQDNISKLSIQTPNNFSQTSNQEAYPQTWRGQLAHSITLLKKLVLIRRDDEDIKPLVSPLFESISKETIRLNLQEAQWAILNDSEAVYQLVLKQALKSIRETFNIHDSNTNALISQLKNLQKITFNQEKPTIDLAIPLINQMIDNKESLTHQKSNNDQGGHES